jgi:hypothetical protein
MMAVYRPRSGVRPLAIAKAIARGRATTPTITPAVRSDVNCERLYDFSVVIDFGTNKTVEPAKGAKRRERPERGLLLLT